MFLKEVSWGHQSCVGFITITIKTAVTYVGRNSTVSTGHQGPAKESVSL